MFLCNSEVWDRAEKIIKRETEEQRADPEMERWIASTALISHLRTGLANCSFDTRVKIIYGFEQVLPQVAYAWTPDMYERRALKLKPAVAACSDGDEELMNPWEGV